MKNGVNKNGNIYMLILPIAFLLITIIILTVVVTCFQISTQIYDVKMNIFNIVMGSVSNNDFENISYRDYKINENDMKLNIEKSLIKNYVKNTNKKSGIVDVICEEVKVLNENAKSTKHNGVIFQTPIICVNVKIVFCPVISFLGKDKEVKIHSDVKLSLLEFD